MQIGCNCATVEVWSRIEPGPPLQAGIQNANTCLTLVEHVGHWHKIFSSFLVCMSLVLCCDG